MLSVKNQLQISNPNERLQFRLRWAQHHLRHRRNIITKYIICDLSQPRSFVPKMNNDVLASLEMMLTFGQMMLCLAAQMKKS
jgi:hypothetical protein